MFTQLFQKCFFLFRHVLHYDLYFCYSISLLLIFRPFSYLLKRLVSAFNCPSILARQSIRELLVQRRFTSSVFWRSSRTKLGSRLSVTRLSHTAGTGSSVSVVVWSVCSTSLRSLSSYDPLLSSTSLSKSSPSPSHRSVPSSSWSGSSNFFVFLYGLHRWCYLLL